MTKIASQHSLSIDASAQVYLAEYSAIISKMNANEGWAYSFVALYFAFMTSLGTAVGFLYSKVMIGKGNEVSSLYGQLEVLAVILSSIGLLLNVWAIYMVYDYKRTTQILAARLQNIEARVSVLIDAPFGAFGSLVKVNHAETWKIGTVLVVGPIMFLFFMPWIVVIAALARS
jgi:hypothetical protein